MALPRTLTVADLYAMPESERGERYELIDRDLRVTPAPAPAHQIISGNVMLNLELHVRANRLGRVIAAPGARVDERTYVVPDIGFIAKPRIGIIGSANVTAAPDLACEILSHANRRYDLMVKRDLYARTGVREYWLVDLAAKSVTLLTLGPGTSSSSRRLKQALSIHSCWWICTSRSTTWSRESIRRRPLGPSHRNRSRGPLVDRLNLPHPS